MQESDTRILLYGHSKAKSNTRHLRLFQTNLEFGLELFASTASRTNLHYSVIHLESDNDKYLKLRELVAESGCPTIVYVSRTKRTKELAAKLTRDGYKALPFNGKMEADEK